MPSMRKEFPPDVDGFLDPKVRKESEGRCDTPLCRGPHAVYKWYGDHNDKEEGGEADERYAQLILSGLLQACMAGIDGDDFCNNHPVDISKALFNVGIEKDAPWHKIDPLRRNITSRERAIAFMRNPDLYYSKTTLIGLSLLKMGLSAINFLGSHSGEHPDAKVTVDTTRLFARAFTTRGGMAFDYDLICAGANVAKWKRVSEAAKTEYEAEGAATRYISSTALPEILKKPSKEDRALLRWMLRRDVFCAIGGWIEGRSWFRGHDVAVTAPSWINLRKLLLVGYRGSKGVLSESELDEKTKDAVALLMRTRVEQKDGSTSPMPIVTYPGNENGVVEEDGVILCYADGCNKRGSKTCSNCQKAGYCSAECQMKDWKIRHKRECKKV